ncbi:MAG: segregation/condensation protein A [Erysipelotrichaceae bacterium]|nr:segregation/condensation protein A [Erysipelotrichaceae bacterium]
MDFVVSLDSFDGPLDLMLHLIKEGNLDLFNLDIEKLADQYINYIHSLQQLHLDIASDYLSQLATLIEYKSKKLLPDNKEEIEDDYEEDNTERLVARLIEYQRYKQVSKQLDSLRLEREEMFDKPMSEIAREWNKANEIDKGNPYSLIKAMERLIERFKAQQPFEVNVQTREITMDDRISQLKIKIRSWPETFTLEDTMRDCKDVYMVVVTFIAILSMINTNILTFSEQNDVIYFKKGVKYE